MKLKRFLSDNLSLGKGAIKIPAKDIIEKYRGQYFEMLEKGLKFKVDLYYVLPGRRIVVHTKVPSETVRNFYYDVLLELEKDGNNFEDCHVKIFSNSPSFVYTYAYVFYHLDDEEKSSKGMIVDEFHKKIPQDRLLVPGSEGKLEEEVLHGFPVVRNPYGLPLFDKTVYYAVFNLIRSFDFNRVMFNKRIISPKKLFSEIRDFDTLMLLRKSEEAKQKRVELEERNAKDSKNILKNMDKQIRRASTEDSAVRVVRPRTSSSSGTVTRVKDRVGGVNKVRPMGK